MSEIRKRKSLVPDELAATPPTSDKGSARPANPRKTRAIVITSIFVVLLALVAYKYAWPESVPKQDLEPVVEEQPDPAKPGQPRNSPPPEPAPVPRGTITG